ncbi:hypothetical protein ACJJTC_012556 [Scirpophaga incertulas]
MLLAGARDSLRLRAKHVCRDVPTAEPSRRPGRARAAGPRRLHPAPDRSLNRGVDSADWLQSKQQTDGSATGESSQRPAPRASDGSRDRPSRQNIQNGGANRGPPVTESNSD